MRKMLPDGVRQRRDKMGFVTPEKVWLKAELGGLLREVTHSTSFIQRGYLDAAQIQGFITDHENDKRDIAFIASRWLTLELWFRQFIDGGVHAFNN
jgi:asparagine synthase (glutamine-hydrolysing)